MMSIISASELGVTDEDLARRILVTARRIAPCLDTLDGEARKNAIAILKGVIAELPETGTARAKALSRDGTSITYAEITSAFTTEARADLRSLCDAPAGGLAEGSFPDARLFERLWPEETYS